MLSDVRVIGTLAPVMEKIQERNDTWGRQVQLRISGYSDLSLPKQNIIENATSISS